MYWEKTLNPHFFAYGSFWSYIVLFLIKIFPGADPFTRAIIFLRTLSALQGVGTIIIAYLVGKILLQNQKSKISAKGGSASGGKNQNDPAIIRRGGLNGAGNSKLKINQPFGNLAMEQLNNEAMVLLLPFLIATSPGLIQASHFGTFENSLTFLYFLMFYFSLKFLTTKRSFFLFLTALVFGISCAIKISSFSLFPIFLLLILISHISLISLISLIPLLFPFFIFLISNPFCFDFSKFPASPAGGLILNSKFWNIFSSDFLSTMNYEVGVARGTIAVFYTQQFQNTVPIFYQFTKILPFVLNPLIWLIFPISLISLITLVPHRETRRLGGSLLILFFLLTFLPNSLLCVKWTRYIIPSLPFIYVMVFLFLSSFLSFPRKRESRIFFPLITLISLISLVFSLFFTFIYATDPRIAAAKWSKTNLRPDSKILSEVYDMGIVPFNDVIHYSQITLFDFYDLDNKFDGAQRLTRLKKLLAVADAIILPSRRIAETRLRLPEEYPNGNWFYKNLFSGKLGFKLANQFSHPYDQIVPFIAPDESFTVFDHPDVYIFKKT